MKKKLLLFLCISQYLFAMDDKRWPRNDDVAERILTLCDVSTFEKFVYTFNRFDLAVRMIEDKKEKERVGSLAWYYSLPAGDRFGDCSLLLDFYRSEIHWKDSGNYNKDQHDMLGNPDRQERLKTEFDAIVNLNHKEEVAKNLKLRLSVGGNTSSYFYKSNNHIGPLQRLKLFIYRQNNPAIKIMLTRSEMLQSLLELDQTYVREQWKINSTDSSQLHILYDVCRNKEGVGTLMHFVPLDKDGNIEQCHFLYVLSMAISVGNKKLITFLVGKKDPEEIKKIRAQIFNESGDDTRPTACQTIACLFEDSNRSKKEAIILAIEKNDIKAREYVENVKSFQELGIDDEMLTAICKNWLANEIVSYLQHLRFKKINGCFRLQSEDAIQKIFETVIEPRGFNEQDQKTIFDLLHSIIFTTEDNDYRPVSQPIKSLTSSNDKDIDNQEGGDHIDQVKQNDKDIMMHDSDYRPVSQRVKSLTSSSDNDIGMQESRDHIDQVKQNDKDITNRDSDYVSKLFDKDISRNKIDKYLKYVPFSVGLIITYFLFLKFHGHFHNSFSSISYP